MAPREAVFRWEHRSVKCELNSADQFTSSEPTRGAIEDGTEGAVCRLPESQVKMDNKSVYWGRWRPTGQMCVLPCQAVSRGINHRTHEALRPPVHWCFPVCFAVMVCFERSCCPPTSRALHAVASDQRYVAQFAGVALVAIRSFSRLSPHRQRVMFGRGRA